MTNLSRLTKFAALLAHIALCVPLLFILECQFLPDQYRAPVSFAKANPNEFAKYSYLYPVSLEIYLSIWGERSGVISYILGEMERRSGTSDSMLGFVKHQKTLFGEDRKQIINFFRELEDLAEEGGIICQYKWIDGKTIEIGFLVLKDGKVLRKEPWLAESCSDDENQIEPQEP